MDVLRPYFKELKIRSYFVENNSLASYSETIRKILSRFYVCATEDRELEPVLLQFINSLNCNYDNKFLNYCKKLNIDQFRDIARKHRARHKDTLPVRKLDGIWYK